MSDVVANRLGARGPCQTHRLALPGGEAPGGAEEAQKWAKEFGIDEVTARRLCARHGARAHEILSSTKDQPERRRVVCECESVTEVEVRHAVDKEWARSVDDVSRRTRLGLGPCGGMRCALSCGRVVAEARGQSPSEGLTSAAEFIQRSLKRRLPAMGPEQARQEALGAAHVYAQAGVSPDGEGSHLSTATGTAKRRPK
jgi:glycerol-3-phosphate dehydrogenase